MLKLAPAFPVLEGGGGAFEQTREFLFMDLCCGYDILEAVQEKERSVPGFAANMARNRGRGGARRGSEREVDREYIKQ